ncbi:hypothetical protein HanOQP8_Chr04g0132751 [Helianthus annuus]|nr:hypothetical protein HanOQP8_Chr04g0132751 [Helianthus annuus]
MKNINHGCNLNDLVCLYVSNRLEGSYKLCGFKNRVKWVGGFTCITKRLKKVNSNTTCLIKQANPSMNRLVNGLDIHVEFRLSSNCRHPQF